MLQDEAPKPSRLPYPAWLLVFLGALTCVAWFGAIRLGLSGPVVGGAPAWLWNSVASALVLLPLAIILRFMRSRRMPRPRHPRLYYLLLTVVTLAAATPALVPFPSTSDLSSLPLRLPALALGVAIAAVDPLVIERWRASRARDSSLALLAGAGFGAATFAIAVIAVTTSHPTCYASARLGCGGLIVVAETSVCGAMLFIIVLALLEAWLGYVIGAFIVRAGYWWDLPRPAPRPRLW